MASEAFRLLLSMGNSPIVVLAAVCTKLRCAPQVSAFRCLRAADYANDANGFASLAETFSAPKPTTTVQVRMRASE